MSLALSVVAVLLIGPVTLAFLYVIALALTGRIRIR